MCRKAGRKGWYAMPFSAVIVRDVYGVRKIAGNGKNGIKKRIRQFFS